MRSGAFVWERYDLNRARARVRSLDLERQELQPIVPLNLQDERIAFFYRIYGGVQRLNRRDGPSSVLWRTKAGSHDDAVRLWQAGQELRDVFIDPDADDPQRHFFTIRFL